MSPCPLRDRRARLPARRRAVPDPVRRAALLPGAPRPVGRPDPQGPADGPQHHRDVRRRGTRTSPRRGEFGPTGGSTSARFLDLVRRRGHARDRAPRPVHLRRVGQRRAARLAVPRPRRRRAPLRAALPRRRSTEYLERVYAIVAPRQIDRGGPVILVQVENEYGAYGDDTDYLRELVRDHPRRRHHGAADHRRPARRRRCSRDGSLPGLHRTGSFGSRAPERLATLREHQPTGPLMCSEFWDGWFDHWGAHHHTTDAADSRRRARRAARGRRVGQHLHVPRRHELRLHQRRQRQGHATAPIVTSYDYDAPLDEAGNPTEKYWAFREVIAQVRARRPTRCPARDPTRPALAAPLDGRSGCCWPCAHATWATRPRTDLPTFDELGPRTRGFGALPHRDRRDGPRVLSRRRGARPRAGASLDGAPVGVLARDAPRPRARCCRDGAASSRSSSRTRAASTTAPGSASPRA